MIDRTRYYTLSGSSRQPSTQPAGDDNNQPFDLMQHSSDLDIKTLLRGVWARSIIGLVLIAILSTTTYFVISGVLKLNERSATIVNISGKQRMLSQRGALFALRTSTAADADTRNAAAKTLAAVANEMETAHDGLINGSETLSLPGNPSDAVRAIYFEAPDNLDQQVKDFIAAIRNLLSTAEAGAVPLDNEDLQYILEASPTRLLQTLNKAVLQYEAEATNELLNALTYEKIIYAITLLTLLLEAFLIYRPLVNRVKRTTKDFLRQLQFSDSVVDTSQALIVGMNQSGTVQLFNQHSEHLTGWKSDEVIGQNFKEVFIPEQQRQMLSDSYDNLLSGGNSEKLETVLTTKDGESLNIEWSNTLLLDPETQQPSLLLSTGLDITKRKQDEQALREAWGETAKLSNRLQTEVAHAALLQQALLPEPEFSLPGIQGIAKLTTSTEVGGDYYDYYQVDDYQSVFLVGDVSGHGVASGTLVSAAKMAVHQLENLKETDPAVMLEHINEQLLSASHESMFMTMVCFSVDSRSGVAKVANAGHVFPYIWIADEGEWCMIEAEGVPLGKVSNPNYESIEFDLEIGDKLFAYTDGILEEESPEGEQFGFERLETLLYDAANYPIDEAHAALFNALENHCQRSEFSDDVTLLLVAHSERKAADNTPAKETQTPETVMQISASDVLSRRVIIDDYLSRQRCVVTSAGDELVTLMPQLCKHGIRRILPEDQPFLQALDWQGLLQQHNQPEGDDARQWIANPVIAKSWSFTHSDDKRNIMSALNTLLDKQTDLSDTLPDVIMLVADELIENSLYGAPQNRSGEPLFSKGDERAIADFEGLRLDLLKDDKTLSLSMTDHWGTFTPTTFLNRLYLHLSGEGGMEAGVGGTGMYLMWRVSDYLQIRVLPNQKTQVSLLWSLTQESDHDTDSGFQFLYHTDINETIQVSQPPADEVSA